MISKLPSVQTSYLEKVRGGIKVFLQIESDSGPEGVQLITSAQQYKILYNSSSTLSYSLGLKLISMGYDLYVKRLVKNTEYISARLFSDGTISHPDKDQTYIKKYPPSEQNEEADVFSEIIEITGPIRDQDYMVLHDGTNFNALMFLDNGAPNGRPVSPDRVNIQALVNFDNVGQGHTVGEVLDEVLYLFKNKLGYYAEVLEQDDSGAGYVKIVLSSERKFIFSTLMLRDTVFQSSYDIIYDYDMECSFNVNNEVLDLFSKYYSYIEDTSVSIIRTDKYHQVRVTKTDESGSIIKEENFIVSLDSTASNYINDTINNNSELIECYYYGDGTVSILGDYTLKRRVVESYTTDDFIEGIEEIELDQFYGDIVIDSGVLDVDYQLTLQNKFSTSLFLFGMTENQDLALSKEFLTLFDSTVLMEFGNVPSYYGLLTLLVDKKVEGRIFESDTLYGPMISSGATPDWEYNQLRYDGYNYEIINPLSYLLEETISFQALLAYVVSSNLLRLSLTPNVNTEKEVKTVLADVVSKVILLLNYSFSAELMSFVQNNRKLQISINFYLGYSYNKEYALTLNIEV